MNCSGKGVKAAHESGRGGVEIFVANAPDAAVLNRRNALPVAAENDLFEWDPASGAAPGRDQHLGCGGFYFLKWDLRARLSNEVTSCRFYQFSHPELRRD